MKNVCGPDHRAQGSAGSGRVHVWITAQMDLWLLMWFYTGCGLWCQGGLEIIFNALH